MLLMLCGSSLVDWRGLDRDLSGGREAFDGVSL